MATRKYDSTVARIAGNILSGVYSGQTLAQRVGQGELHQFDRDVVTGAVWLAREIVTAVLETEPEKTNE